MIRVVTLDAFEEGDVASLCKQLFQAFNIGCEFAGKLPLPEEAELPDGSYDAELLLHEAESVKLVADDKLLYLTHAKLQQPEGPVGRPPTYGHAQFAGQRAVSSTALFPKSLEEGSDEFKKRLAKQAIHDVGRLWELHTCIDPKCSMHTTWSEAFETHPEPILCNFCREKSEERIRMAKT